MQRVAKQQLKRKLELEPDPVDATADDHVAPAPPPSTDAGARLPSGARGGPLAAEPTSRDDAAARIVGAARYLRQNDPYNPAAVSHAARLPLGRASRGGGGNPDPKLLEAPPTSVRTNLKRLAARREMAAAARGVRERDGHAAGTRVARPPALRPDRVRIGSAATTSPVATAMRGALRSLLADLPQARRHDADGRHADGECRDAGVAAVADPDADDSPPASSRQATPSSTSSDGNGESHGRDPMSLAMRRGARGPRRSRHRAADARGVAREDAAADGSCSRRSSRASWSTPGTKPSRSRFSRSSSPTIEAHKLEEWEAGELVAAPMALLYRVLEKTEGDPATRQRLYLRICRLDPMQAISFAQRSLIHGQARDRAHRPAVAPGPADRRRPAKSVPTSASATSESVRQFKAAVQRDLEWLLNTRRIADAPPEELEELTRSVYHYGCRTSPR